MAYMNKLFYIFSIYGIIDNKVFKISRVVIPKQDLVSVLFKNPAMKMSRAEIQ